MIQLNARLIRGISFRISGDRYDKWSIKVKFNLVKKRERERGRKKKNIDKSRKGNGYKIKDRKWEYRDWRREIRITIEST